MWNPSTPHTQFRMPSGVQKDNGCWRPVDVDMEARWDSNSRCMQYPVKLQRFPEIFRAAYDPDALAQSPPIDPSWQQALEDVFGDCAKGEHRTIKLALHPHMKRWCIWEKRQSAMGENVWQPRAWFMEEPRDGYLPADLNAMNQDKRCEELRGCMGDFLPPNRKDMEEYFAKWDRYRTSAGQRQKQAEEPTKKPIREANAKQVEREKDMLHEQYCLDREHPKYGVRNDRYAERVFGRVVYWQHKREDGTVRYKQRVTIGSPEWERLVSDFCMRQGIDDVHRLLLNLDAPDPQSIPKSEAEMGPSLDAAVKESSRRASEEGRRVFRALLGLIDDEGEASKSDMEQVFETDASALLGVR